MYIHIEDSMKNDSDKLLLFPAYDSDKSSFSVFFLPCLSTHIWRKE